MWVDKILVVNRKIKIARLSRSERLGINLGVSAWQQGSGSSNKHKCYYSSIQDVGKSSFYIMVPSLLNKPLLLQQGEQVYVQVIGNNELYCFNTVVLGKKEEQIFLYSLAIPEIIERVQQRKYVRLATLMEVDYAEILEDKIPLEYIKSRCLDLSGGGIRLAVNRPYLPGSKIAIRFQLPLKGRKIVIEVNSRVVRVETVEEKKERIYHLGLEFENITRKQQDEIFAYIFNKMLEQKQVGL